MITKNIPNAQLEVLSQIESLEDYRSKEFYWLYALLSAKGERFKEEVSKARKLRETQMKDKDIFEILSAGGLIDQNMIFESFRLIAERLMTVAPEIEKKILLRAKVVNIDIKEGKTIWVDNQDKGRVYSVLPAYALLYRDIVDPHTSPIVLGTKSSVEDVNVRARRYSKAHSNDFTLLDIVKDAISQNTSDIHFKYGEFFTVHFRIDGYLTLQRKYTMDRNRYDELLRELFIKASQDTGKGFNADDRMLLQQGKIEYPDLKVRLRVQTIPKGDDNDSAMVASTNRIIKLGVSIGTIDDLKGYGDDMLHILKRATMLTSGLILFSGVTNSGKSFTIAHMMMSMPHGKCVVTGEDPIEYTKNRPDTTQHQTFSIEQDGVIKAKVGFSELMKGWKRFDPDITEIGEIREDPELISSVTSSVQAGNLVLSTIHINTVFSVPSVLVTTFEMNRYAVGDLLKLLVNQVLVPKLCSHCKEPDTELKNFRKLKEYYDEGLINYAYLKPLEKFLEEKPQTWVASKNGCIHCDYIGTKGLVPIYEFLRFDTKASTYFSGDAFLKRSKAEVEEHFCTRAEKEGNRYLAKNKLATYIEKLILGEVDTSDRVVNAVLL